jgi:hypothetical protein
MAKLIFEDRKGAENVVKDTSSPNGVRLTHLHHVVRVWRITKRNWTYTTERRYIISHYGWDDARAAASDMPPDFSYDTLIQEGKSEAEAIRQAIDDFDTYLERYGLEHADMSYHPAYKDVVLAPLAVVEA